MYLEHFKLNYFPFQLNPDSDVFYASSGHQKAFSYLEFGIGKGEGFIVITGEVGAGKTTLIEHLFSIMDNDDLISVRLSSSQFEAEEMLIMVAHGLNITTIGKRKAEINQEITQFINHCVTDDKHILIVIDEAQNIPLNALEELRMITNYQYQGVTPIQIFLLGQPEFRTTLNSPQTEQLSQRVVARYHLGALQEDEIGEYINYRMSAVSDENQRIFNSKVFPLIYDYSKGIPRIINKICDRGLISAYLEGQKSVTPKIINNVIRELDDEKSSGHSKFQPSYVPIVDEVDFLI